MKRRHISSIVVAVLAYGSFAAVLIGLARGAPVPRWRPVSLMTGAAVASEILEVVRRALLRSRAERQAMAPVPRGVLLRTPLWIEASEFAALATLASLGAAIPAALGHAGVGVGILATVAALLLLLTPTKMRYIAQSLTFEHEGLRVGVRGASILVPWGAIIDVRRGGVENHLVSVDFVGAAEVVRSVVPDTPRARLSAGVVVGSSRTQGDKATMTLDDWTAGLDGAVLAREISASRRLSPPN